MNAFLEIPVLPQRSIVLHPPLSDEEFERMSQQCDGASLERSKEGAILVNAPAGGSTSSGNAEITWQLNNWWKNHRRGRVFDSSGGFFLPDGSVLSPDAAYITAEQGQGLTREERARFLRLAPAFVSELHSESDTLAHLMEKMETWLANGVQLAWLVDPVARAVHIYAPSAAPRVETGLHIAGSGPVKGFLLDAAEVWQCFD